MTDADRAVEVFRAWATGSEPAMEALTRAIREARLEGAHEAYDESILLMRECTIFSQELAKNFKASGESLLAAMAFEDARIFETVGNTLEKQKATFGHES